MGWVCLVGGLRLEWGYSKWTKGSCCLLQSHFGKATLSANCNKVTEELLDVAFVLTVRFVWCGPYLIILET